MLKKQKRFTNFAQVQHLFTKHDLNHKMIMAYKKSFRATYLFISAIISTTCSISAQQISLSKSIRIAQENSFDAQMARYSYLASYWTYRSFQAQLLPAVNIRGDIANFDHSMVAARNFEDGRVAYVDNNSMSNSLTLSVDQEIAATGGTVSLQSYLYRLDQFTYNEKTYNSQPMRISYTQPLRSYNSLKWEKKTAPVQYEIAKKTYMSAMQDIALNATRLYFNVLAAQSTYKQSLSSLSDREALYEMAQQRLKLGTTTKSEVLQMELSLINAKVSVRNDRLALDNSMYDLFSYLRVTDYEKAELQAPLAIPDVVINTDIVIQKAIENSSHTQQQKYDMMEAERSLAQAKANRGLQMTLNGQVGFTQTASTFKSAYTNMRDNEIVGLTLSLPIFDWGVSRGRVKMAKAQLEVTKTQLEQAHQDYLEELRRKVTQFNSQPALCRDAMRAQEIAEERYGIMRCRFEAGSISVTDLNTAQQEMEHAKAQYISQLMTFWSDYYSLQKSTLYDWMTNSDISVDFDSLVK